LDELVFRPQSGELSAIEEPACSTGKSPDPKASMSPRHILHALRNAFRSRGFNLFGMPFARDYLWFALRGARSWGHTGPGALNFLGTRIEYPNQSHALFLLHEVFVLGTYAFRSSSTAPRIVDCGANIGITTLFFKALFPEGRVLAVEAHPDTCRWLRANVEANALQDVEIRPAAVADREGTVTLFSPEADPGSMVSSLRRGSPHGAATVQVPAIRLSQLIREPVDFLKLDVEGAEYAVVRELVASGAIRWIREAVIEFHTVPESPDGPAALRELLVSAGMDVSVDAGGLPDVGIMRARRSPSALKAGSAR
jgi:FkbM family methyltransferase